MACHRRRRASLSESNVITSRPTQSMQVSVPETSRTNEIGFWRPIKNRWVVYAELCENIREDHRRCAPSSPCKPVRGPPLLPPPVAFSDGS